jgi:hypothetical protein
MVIRIALIFFFVQLLVVLMIMIAALLLARPEVPVWGREPGHQALRRSLVFVTHLPSRVVRSLAQRLSAKPT